MTIGIKHGDDGYAYVDFYDGLGRSCHMVEAHAGEHSHLLLGRAEKGPRMTLGPEHVESLLPLLQHFAKTGELAYPDDHGDDRVHEPLDLITYAEPANGRIRLDMRVSGAPMETWQLTEAQARGVILVLSLAVKGRAMTAQAEAAPAREVKPFGDCVAIVKETDPPVFGDPNGPYDFYGYNEKRDRDPRALQVPCDTCDGTGTVTPDGGHGQNGNDTCKRCKGRKMIPADPYEGARMAAAARGEETGR